MTKFQFEAIGTHWEIEIKEELSKERQSSLYKKIQDRIGIFDKNYSRFREDSLVTKIEKEGGKFVMPDDFEEMFLIYKKAYEVTSGLVTPLVGDLLVSAGYDSKYSLKKGELISPLKWEEVLEWNKPYLNVKKPTVLDFGACGKGYLVDIVSYLIETEGLLKYTVDASGDMRNRGGDIRVGLEHPADKESVVGVLVLRDESMCGSSGNRRKWADMHHIVNPKTLTSPENILSVWTLAENTTLSDILTTCLFFVSPEELKKHFQFEYFILNEDFSIKKSEGFNAEVFIN